MGRFRKRFKKEKANSNNNSSESSENKLANNGGSWTLSPKSNADFETYYKMQAIVPLNEWDDFISSLQSQLPSTFRITGTTSQSKDLLSKLKGDYISNLTDITIDGKSIAPPTCISWYPNEMVWQLSLDRKTIRHIDELKSLHNFLVQETESGAISRQEIVSMIPPLLMDIKPHHKVLDMCAAPGSKTSQILEMLHADESQPIPPGVVIANDANNKRCYMMTHQVKRIESANFIITNHDASILPTMYIRNQDEQNPEKRVPMYFDRILADVPCSGDGTLRKNPDIWTKWSSANGISLHGLQCRILSRGLELLEVGGRIVYSTCSFNPIEDEAVVSHILRKCKGSAELVDISAELKGLKSVPGVASWKVTTKNGAVFEKVEDVPQNITSRFRPSLFPPSDEEASQFNLNRCMRILPHHQNTGGFFVAAFVKTEQVPWVKPRPFDPAGRPKKLNESSCQPSQSSDVDKEDLQTEGGTLSGEDVSQTNETKSDDVSDQDNNSADINLSANKVDLPPRKKLKHDVYNEKPFIFLETDDDLLSPIKSFYGLVDFPFSQLFIRCAEGKKRNIYFASELVKKISTNNDEKIKFINMGLKLFSRSDSALSDCAFRLAQDGIYTLSSYMNSRCVTVSHEDLATLFTNQNPYISKLTSETASQLNKIGPGGLAFICKPSENAFPPCKIVISGWRGKASARTFLGQNDRLHFMRLCNIEPKTKENLKEADEKNDENGQDENVDQLTNEDNINVSLVEKDTPVIDDCNTTLVKAKDTQDTIGEALKRNTQTSLSKSEVQNDLGSS